MSDALDIFLKELEAAHMPAASIAELRPIFHKLALDHNPATIQLCDDVVGVVRRRRPLMARLVDVVKLFERAAAAR
jgi:hypothetical protein